MGGEEGGVNLKRGVCYVQAGCIHHTGVHL